MLGEDANQGSTQEVETLTVDELTALANLESVELIEVWLAPEPEPFWKRLGRELTLRSAAELLAVGIMAIFAIVLSWFGLR
jgi:hypothetical protein